ncbi:uncharacterized protein LOC109605174 [Aethina tumida]|uniref:uncharacterized protein LOC109605174 n=1 Tax=Aethina tumida TaxID=116153 RepID=UPI002147C73D|nr:uncharacterized protein LOC109605174 [Aethina tumida]
MSSYEKKGEPLMCTTTSDGHVDYGIPFYFAKSNDYRSSTRRAHDHIPSKPFTFSHRVKAIINPNILNVDERIKSEEFKTSYQSAYDFKPAQDQTLNKIGKARHKNDFGKSVEEKLLANPLPVGKIKISEMKDNYRMNYYKPEIREVGTTIKAPSTFDGIVEKNEMPTAGPGVLKHFDIYLTENKLGYPSYSPEELKMARTPLITYYSATGKCKGFDGELTPSEKPPTQRLFSRAMPRVPNFGMSSTYKEAYKDQNYSELHPFINTKNALVKYDSDIESAGPWQNTCAPGMYCTEGCHIGTGWPISAVLDIEKTPTIIPHNVKSCSRDQRFYSLYILYFKSIYTMSSYEKKGEPLMCTTTADGHVDYGIPFYFAKSNDYRSSTRRAHDHIPSEPYTLSQRVKAVINPNILNVDERIGSEGFKSSYQSAYVRKPAQDDPLYKIGKAPHTNDFVKFMQENLLANPPPMDKISISEMKDNYRMNFYKPEIREIGTTIEVSSTYDGNVEKSDLPTAGPGVLKHFDIYMTENKLKYPSYSPKELKMAGTHLITYYSATGKWKGFDGELRPSEKPPTQRLLSKAMPRVPNFGMRSTYKETYKDQNYSELYPFVNSKNALVKYDSDKDSAGPWQSTCAPGMYCTESCHVGTGWPVSAVLEIEKTPTTIPHNVKTCSKDQR